MHKQTNEILKNKLWQILHKKQNTKNAKNSSKEIWGEGGEEENKF